MINNSEDFSRIYSDLLSRHKYRELASLLSSTTFNDEATKDTAAKLAERFQEQADIEDKLLEGADDRTRKSYNFITTGPNKEDWTDESGKVNKDTPAYRFMQAWNSLGNESNIIKFNFNDGNEFNKFISALGGNESKIREMGITLEDNYGVSFSTDIQDKVSIFNAINSTNILDNITKRLSSAREIEREAHYIIGSDLNKATTDRRDAERLYYSNFAVQLRNMKNSVLEANEDYAKLLTSFKPYLTEMIVTGYMGEDDRQLQQSFSNGLIDLQSFKELRKILEEKYNRVLQTKSLSQYDVWAINEDNEGSQVLQPLTDNIAKSDIDLEINQAIADGRLHYSHATNGLDIGTMIVIDQKIDDKGKVVGDSKPIRLFVKDLFRSQAENSLRDDTQIVAQQQYSKHQTYGHIYRTSNGGTIDNWNQITDSAIYTDKNGITQNIDKAQALDIIDVDVITRRFIDYYNNVFKTDNNGDYYTQEYYKVFAGNTPTFSLLYDNLKAKCFNAMSLKYKDQSPKYIEYRANELLSTILQGLKNKGVGFTDEDILSLKELGVNLK